MLLNYSIRIGSSLGRRTVPKLLNTSRPNFIEELEMEREKLKKENLEYLLKNAPRTLLQMKNGKLVKHRNQKKIDPFYPR